MDMGVIIYYLMNTGTGIGVDLKNGYRCSYDTVRPIVIPRCGCGQRWSYVSARHFN